LFWVGLEPPTRRSRSKSAHKCIPYNKRCVKIFIQIGWGPKNCFWVKIDCKNLLIQAFRLMWDMFTARVVIISWWRIYADITGRRVSSPHRVRDAHILTTIDARLSSLNTNSVYRRPPSAKLILVKGRRRFAAGAVTVGLATRHGQGCKSGFFKTYVRIKLY